MESRLVRRPQTPTAIPFSLIALDRIAAPVETELSAVETTGSRYLCDRRAFGPPPVFMDTAFDGVRRTATCDRTQFIEAYTCYLGVAGVRATSPVILNVTYDSLLLRAHVVDADSTPEQNDVVEVSATLGDPEQPPAISIPLLDDGALMNVSHPFDALLTCYDDPIDGVCTCRQVNPPTYSGDPVGGDEVYTRQPALSYPALPYPADSIAQGCIIQDSPRRPLVNFFPVGESLPITLRASDRIGNVSETSGTVTPVGASVSCTGDPCGCCLLVQPVIEQCGGLDGMTSPEVPGGLCNSFPAP
jgi:hypothetical protein